MPSWGETLARRVRVQKLEVQLTNADLTAAAATQVIALGTLPANAILMGTSLTLTDAFDSAGAGSLDIQIGDDTIDDDSLVAAFDAYTGSTNEGLVGSGTLGIGATGTPSGLVLEILLTATTDLLNTFTGGDVLISVYYLEYFA